MLALSGDADGPPVQAAAQIADIAGGALMAAFGILPRCARRPARASSSTSRWPTARCRCWRCRRRGLLAGGEVPRRGELMLGGRLLCYRPYRVRRRVGVDGRAGAEVLGGVLSRRGPRGPCRAPVRRARVRRARARSRPCSRRARAPSGRRSTPSTTAAWSRCWSSTRSCRRARRRARHGRDGLLATPVRLSGTPADYARGGPPGLGEHTAEVLAEAGYDESEIACALTASGAVEVRRRRPLLRAARRRALPGDGADVGAVGPAPSARRAAARAADRVARAHRAARRHGARAGDGRDPGAVPIAEVEFDVGRAARAVGRAARGRAAGGRSRGAASAGVAGAGVAGRDAARRRRSRCPRTPIRRRPSSARPSATRTPSSGAGRRAGGPSAGRRRSGRACGSRSSRARSRRRASG